ncbi:hypothetical protein J8273_3583 [Carpediemonas membranifera]|uniref:Uncharacterized protein n=1 Tax=Carpediemonas membranifera TaxID=201153 RepID=A0A8J6DZC6_9EUKA|nr:hypothetical protein J8273_3583 [Carpediemonas membranifera]|eukprot:KAG9393444.1 hypothetical protein J8273_3583 [Carpediemonas membranifera]
MNSASSSPSAIRDALISAFRESLVVTASISGDIPSLLQCAYSRHFGVQMPSIHNNKSTVTPTSAPSLESLLATLSKLPPLEPAAQALLDRARSILTSGPPLSMNVELADGEELPVALHTLNQGAVWACLLGGGANPDLEDRVLNEAREKWPDETDMHDKIRKALTPEAKCLWFLCRKFFFTLNVAEKDGESYQYTVYGDCYHHRMYMGRLFMLDTDYHAALTRARMPRALEVYSAWFTLIARTPKGLWGWGACYNGELGFQSSGFVDPTRLTFPACPKVAELEASLPAWEKHRMVTDLSMERWQTFILTPVGTVMAGGSSEKFVDPVEREKNKHLFHPVAVPGGFVPDHIMHVGPLHAVTVILSMGDRQVISGDNQYGRLGLGHENEMTAFEELPFSVDLIMPSLARNCNVFLGDRQLHFAGLALLHVTHSGLLPGYREGNLCLTATQLRFPERVKGFFCNTSALAWVTEGLTHLCIRDIRMYCVQFEATAFGQSLPGVPGADVLRDSTSQWFRVARVTNRVAEMVECEVPSSQWEIAPVDVDPWPEQ